MVLYYLSSRGLRKIEGREFTLRAHRNSQDSVRILNETQVPLAFLDVEARIPGSLWQSVLADLPQETARLLSGCLRQMKPSNEAIKQAVTSQEAVPGAEVRRGFHLRVF
jgi:Siphovirus Gp157